MHGAWMPACGSDPQHQQQNRSIAAFSAELVDTMRFTKYDYPNFLMSAVRNIGFQMSQYPWRGLNFVMVI